jgi:hypothetical protein
MSVDWSFRSEAIACDAGSIRNERSYAASSFVPLRSSTSSLDISRSSRFWQATQKAAHGIAFSRFSGISSSQCKHTPKVPSVKRAIAAWTSFKSFDARSRLRMATSRGSAKSLATASLIPLDYGEVTLPRSYKRREDAAGRAGSAMYEEQYRVLHVLAPNSDPLINALNSDKALLGNSMRTANLDCTNYSALAQLSMNQHTHQQCRR